jgi:hypothetical protein
MRRVVIWTTLLVTLFALPPAYATEQYVVTLRDLVTDPASFQGKTVRVKGVLDLRFELHGIRHGKFHLSLNFFRPIDEGEVERNVEKVEAQVKQDWMRIREWQRAGWHGKWVEVVGVFDPEETGHFGMVKSGGLRDIETVMLKEVD